ncbi:unnamed protein product [Protopolystoma xenopodis]|uniref:Suppressor of fused-like domain-containing protein n=1 Tax=Protopolystoma xenopodis TaxID=117903 RepID=A0A448WHM8_9PLAT|nr:unnamed protein product [Protopolystoma xenopodis]
MNMRIPAASPCGPSGFGFELTFRLRRDPSDLSPPTWPASLLQSLARYVFRANAQLRPGDHIPWHSPLDRPPHLNSQQHIQSGSGANNETKSVKLSCDKEAVVGTSKPSSIRHMLVVRDPQLKKIITPYGYVEFLQIVGLMDDELQLVQRWTGLRLAGLLRGESYRDVGIEAVGTAGHVVHNIDSADCPLLGTISSVAVSDSSAESAANLEASLSLGGPLLVTDMRRHSSLLVLRPGLAQLAEAAVTRQGSSLSGVTLRLLAWRAPPCSLKPSVSVGSNGGETGGAETTGSFSAKFDWIASLIPGELEAETQRRRTQVNITG